MDKKLQREIIKCLDFTLRFTGILGHVTVRIVYLELDGDGRKTDGWGFMTKPYSCIGVKYKEKEFWE